MVRLWRGSGRVWGVLTPSWRSVRAVLCVAVASVFVAVSCGDGERPVLVDTALAPVSAAQESAADLAASADADAAAAAAAATAAAVAEAEAATAEAETAPAADCLRPRQWVAQTLMVLATQDELDAVETLASRGEVGGVTILGTPDATIGQDLGRLDQAGPVPILAASDEEGGVVQRLADIINPLDAAATQATRSPDAVRSDFAAYGARMVELGFDIAFAPVVDIGGGPGIGTRSFGSDPAVVTQFASAVAQGFRDAGITPVYKHFPGHGRASGDSHLGLPTAPAYSELVSLDLVPYDTLLDEPDAAVMVAHLLVPGLSDETPTSLSPNTVGALLRGVGGGYQGKTYNFDGLVFTDALNMGAIVDNVGTTEAALQAVIVGADVVILGGADDVGPVLDAMLTAVGSGELTWERVDSAVQRVLDKKGVTAARC